MPSLSTNSHWRCSAGWLVPGRLVEKQRAARTSPHCRLGITKVTPTVQTMPLDDRVTPRVKADQFRRQMCADADPVAGHRIYA